jgi:hypothetical protein
MRVWFWLAAAASCAVALGCTASTSRAPEAESSSPNVPIPTPAPSSSCIEDDERACTVKLGTIGGVEACWAGRQRCEDGVWAACAVRGVSESKTESFGVSCPNGSRARWTTLAYEAVTPENASGPSRI